MINWPNFGQVYSVVRMSSALLAVGIGLLTSRLAVKLRPSHFLKAAFFSSGLFLLATAVLAARDGKSAAVLLWVYTALFNLVLSTMFWAAVQERYGPRGTRTVGPVITSALAIGSIFSVVLTYFLRSSPYLLPLFASGHILCALLTAGFASPGAKAVARSAAAAPGLLDGLRQPYPQLLAALLFLASISAFLLSFGLQMQVKTWAAGRSTAQVTSLFAGLNLTFWFLAFLAQTFLVRFAMARAGPAGSAAIMHAGVLAAAGGALVAPGLAAICVLRGVEISFRNSVFRSGYEVLYSPIPPERRRSLKSAIDVCADSLGDFAGAALLTIFPLLRLAASFRWNIAAVIAATSAGLVAALNLRRSYRRELERGIVDRGSPECVEESGPLWLMTIAARHSLEMPDQPAVKPITALDPEKLAQAIALVRTRDAAAAKQAWQFLEHAAQKHPGQLLDVLLDSDNEPFTRRTVAKALAASSSPITGEGLLVALSSESFAIRRQVAGALRRWCEGNPGSALSSDRVVDAVMREIERSRMLWEHALDLRQSSHLNGKEGRPGIIRDRARAALHQVFSLLTLILPPEPLRVSEAALQSGDEYLRGISRGISLEYLECVLPERVRDALSPFIEAERPKRTRSQQELIAEIARLSPTMRLRISETDENEQGEGAE
jgi:hypothetical protein